MNPQRFALLLLPEFPLMSFSSVMTSLHEANRLSQRALYEVTVLSETGASVTSLDGVQTQPSGSIRDDRSWDFAFVCAGLSPKTHTSKTILTWLRRQLSRSVEVGAISTGTYVLAQTGCLAQRRCTIHWENAASFAEEFPTAILSDGVFEVDGPIWTCSGGIAAMDMMLNLIARDHGVDLAMKVSHQFQHDRVRTPKDLQNSLSFFSQQNTSPSISRAMQFMHESDIATLTLAEVVQSSGLSQRQLDRLFKQHLGKTPSHYLTELRLQRARELLLSTDRSIIEVSLAAGFASRSNFYRAYTRHFAKTPKQERNSRERF